MNSPTPSPRNQIPAIYTDIDEEFSISLNSPTSPQPEDVPSLRVSGPPHTPISPTTPRKQSSKSKTTNRAWNESRKLLSHVLDQLERRTLPPSVLDALDTAEREVVILKKHKLQAKAYSQTGPDSDSDNDGEYGFSSDATYDLMMQFKDVLIMAADQGWHIFDDNNSVQHIDDQESGSGKSPFRRTRNSLQPGNRRSHSRSDASQTRPPELLSSCISVLASVVLEDCRYQIASPRPSRPPNSLQALTLEIAQFLLHTNRYNPSIIAKIGFAMIPAFSTFPTQMHCRLLTFFETTIVGRVLEDLQRIQGLNGWNSGTDTLEKSLDSEGSSIVAIHIDPVLETPHNAPEYSQWTPWPSSTDAAVKLRSTHIPYQSMTLYSLSSLLAPLLATILECINLQSTDVLHLFCRLLRLIINNKIDAYCDILQVAAYHTPKARRIALSILCAFWPKAIGHIVVSRPFSETYTLQAATRVTEPHSHQFVPWRFCSKSNGLGFAAISQHNCRACFHTIQGFGMLCPMCMCTVHFDCYDHPGGSHFLEYSLPSDPNVRRVAMYRFSIITTGQTSIHAGVTQNAHVFQPVNIFTLCLCLACKKPLWGCTNQGLNCTSCKQFIHRACLSDLSPSEVPYCSSPPFDSDHISIGWDELRCSCIDFYHDLFRIPDEELATKGFEDISIFHAILWMQLQIVTSGIALGSVVVPQSGGNSIYSKDELDEFELHRFVRTCENLLSSGKLLCSDATDDYMEENRLSFTTHFMMFDWSNIIYICSALKSPSTHHNFAHGFSSDLLNATQQGHLMTLSPNITSQPFEVVPLSYMRDALGHGFNVHSDLAARLLLSHFHHLGLFDRIDQTPVLFSSDSVSEICCVFPLPFGLDFSPNVETLVSTIEACLHDIDLSINEVGLLLLIRRLWPNGLTSEYALRRLTRSLLSWILAEDDHFAIILRDYLARQKSLPGVRSSKDPVLWPLSHSSRSTPASSVNNGGDYLATRRALLSRYIKPWLLALHDLDTTAYATLIYEVLETLVAVACDPLDLTLGTSTHKSSRQLDQVLRWIARLTQSYVAFDAFDDLFSHWLESVMTHGVHEEPILSLSRLFPREVDISNHYPAGSEQLEIQVANSSIEPWRVVTRIAAESKDGLIHGLQWLSLFAHSGIEIPSSTFKQFSELCTKYLCSLADSLLLAKSVMYSTWIASKARVEIQVLLSELHARHRTQIWAGLKSTDVSDYEESISFIRISLVTRLLLYGCNRAKLFEFYFIKEQDIKGVPSRRKLNFHGSVVEDPVIIDSPLMEAIDSYLVADIEEIICLIVKFLYLFLTDSPYLEAYEVDNFILRNGRLLASCAWQAYDMQNPEISALRTHFLLRILVIDSEPLQRVLETWFSSTSSWERRLLAVTRLFRVILDVTSPSFTVEGRQWQSSVVDIFYYFFSSLWLDEREEIRVAVNTFSASLHPAHFEAISACWNESLSKAPVAERTKLVSFLIQLRPYFPHWTVLSWDAISAALSEDEYAIGGETATSALPPHDANDPDLLTLRVSLVFLGLHMIADGVQVDSFTLLKIKHHLVQVIGFRDVSVMPSSSGQFSYIQFGDVPEIPDIVFPCVSQLLVLMDSSCAVDLPPSMMAGANAQDDRPVSALVGSIFVDVFLAIFCSIQDLVSLPIVTLKNMLETLCVVVYKHDFESSILKHLQQTLRRAVIRTLDCLGTDISYDLRQLALSVIQAFIKRWHTFTGSIIYMAIESVAKLAASQHQHGQDALVAQARTFIDTTLTRYAHTGLFSNFLKRSLDQDFFLVLKQVTEPNAKGNPTVMQNLRENLLRDLFARPIDADQPFVFQNVLNNMQSYVEVVFNEGYSGELMQFVGQHLTHIARRTSEWPSESIDPGPILIICATLIQHNKLRTRDILSYVDTVLRVLLNRLNVNTDSLSRLLQVTNALHRKSQTNDSAPTSNSIFHLMLEMLGDGLRLKARVPPTTLRSLLLATTTTEAPGSLPPIIKHLPSFLGLVDPGILFLQAHLWQEVDSDFNASIAVARMLLQVSGQDPTVTIKLADYGIERAAHTNFKVRSWSILVLAALLETRENWHSTLFGHLPSFSYAHHGALRAYAQGTGTLESSTIDINHAYIAIKLWILLAYKVAANGNIDRDTQIFSVWNELWPPFESLINQFEVDAWGHYTTLRTLVLSSIADLFIFMRSLHTPPALHTSTHITTLNRLRNLGPGETVNQKLSRALRYMSERPPETSFENLVGQAVKDIVAAEKLRIMDGRTVQDRRAPERQKREMRATT